MITGTPESRAAPPFPTGPSYGKLKALMNSATPRVGTSTWCDWKTVVLAQAAGLAIEQGALSEGSPSLA